MKTKEKYTFQFRIGIIALTIVVLHVVLAFYVVFVPEKRLVRHKIVSIYQKLFVLGPFFSESRIKSSHYLSVRYKQHGKWSSPREYGKEQFLLYSRMPWRIDRILYNDYEKRLAFKVGELTSKPSFENIKNNPSFRELNEFYMTEYIQTPVDSVHMVYGLHLYIPKTKTYMLDTIFNYTYNPKTVGKSKK